jgi:hypothetical protein
MLSSGGKSTADSVLFAWLRCAQIYRYLRSPQQFITDFKTFVLMPLKVRLWLMRVFSAMALSVRAVPTCFGFRVESCKFDRVQLIARKCACLVLLPLLISTSVANRFGVFWLWTLSLD